MKRPSCSAAPLRHLTVGADRFELSLGRISGVFGLVFVLQTAYAFQIDLRSTPGAPGVVSVSLVVASVLCGACAAVWPKTAHRLLIAAFGSYAAAALVWLFAIQHPIPDAPYPYFLEVAIASFCYLAVACRHAVVALSAGFAMAAYLGAVLTLAGGVSLASALIDAIFLAAMSIGMTVLVTAVRRGVRRADSAQEVALAGFARIQSGDATEAERRRTDALLHDAVLTTYLTAASAQTPEEEELAVRMAANARRVLAHVNSSAQRGPAVMFEQAYSAFQAELEPLLPSFAVRAESLDVVLPAEVADAMLRAMVQAMLHSLEYADIQEREVRISPLGPDGLRIIVRDDGGHFATPGTTPAVGSMRSLVIDRMRRVDGRADITAVPGEGCTVVLSWGSVVMGGVDPLPDSPLAVTR